MAYFELRIGNTFKDESKYVESEGEFYKIDKSQYIIMYSDILQYELLKTRKPSLSASLYMLSFYMDKKTNALLHKKQPLNCKQIASMLDEKYETFRRIMWELVQLELVKKDTLNGQKVYIVNPYFAFKGKSVSTELYELFKDTKWATYEDLSEYMPKRGDVYYNDWVINVLERDNHTCQCCSSKINLQAHHIKPYAKHKELRTDVRNGITLCECCHSPMILNGFHQKYGTYNNTPEQLQEYIDNKRKELGLSSIVLEEIINKRKYPTCE